MLKTSSSHRPAAETIEVSLRRWMTEEALPFWASRGLDQRNGLFFERLLPDASPDLEAPLRVRVQFRQIYSLSHAAVLGWYPEGGKVALAVWQATLEKFWKRDTGGFCHILAADGSIVDDRADSYDHAFAVLALSWLARATGDAQVRSFLDYLLAYVDSYLTDANGILLEGRPHRGPRRQNPQMHWFEAMLGLHDALGHPEGLKRAAHFRAFFNESLFDEQTGTLGEFFNEDWSFAAGPEGQSVEPGHQAEWTWLLRTHERLAGLATDRTASRLLDTACRAADPATGLLVDETDRQLNVRRGTRRSWLQTELCKAWLSEVEAGRKGAVNHAIAALETLDRRYLRQPFSAGWIDQLDEAARPVKGPVPASILYHVLVAVIEADRVLGTRA